jgi:hypothetical protein
VRLRDVLRTDCWSLHKANSSIHMTTIHFSPPSVVSSPTSKPQQTSVTLQEITYDEIGDKSMEWLCFVMIVVVDVLKTGMEEGGGLKQK